MRTNTKVGRLVAHIKRIKAGQALFKALGRPDTMWAQITPLVDTCEELAIPFVLAVQRPLIAIACRTLMAKVRDGSVIADEARPQWSHIFSPFPGVAPVAAAKTCAALEARPSAFDPYRPSVGNMDGSLEDKLIWCGDLLVKDIFATFVEEGAHGSYPLKMAAEAVISEYEQFSRTADEAITESLPSVFVTTLQVCKAR